MEEGVLDRDRVVRGSRCLADGLKTSLVVANLSAMTSGSFFDAKALVKTFLMAVILSFSRLFIFLSPLVAREIMLVQRSHFVGSYSYSTKQVSLWARQVV